MKLTDKVKNIKKGAYLNASQYKGDDAKVAFDALAKINFRGSLNIRGTRGHIATIYDQLTAAEKQYISLAEKIFNEDCKNAKREVDMQRKGFSIFI